MKFSAASHAIVSGSQAQDIRDITAEEAADWITDEFHAIADMHGILARIAVEEGIVENNKDNGEFPMTQFAHETLLAELRAEYSRQTIAMVSSPRTIH
jgi:penicillin V acylase-like amidase (Ntn superfamily)